MPKTTRLHVHAVATALAVAAMLTGCGASGDPNADTAGGCTPTASTPQGGQPLIAVLTGTTSTNPKVAAARGQAYAKVVSAASNERARLLVDTIGGGVFDEQLTVNEQIVGAGANDLERDSDLQCKRQSAESGFAAAQKNRPSGPTDVLSALQVLQGHLSGVPRSETDVVLFGDLINRAAPIDLTNPAALASPDAAIAQAQAKGLLPDCKGWSVYAVTSGALDGERTAQLREFWRRFFNRCGGRLAVWDPALPTFPVPGATVAPVAFSDAPPIPPLQRTPTGTTAVLPAHALFDTGSSTLSGRAATALEPLLSLTAVHPMGAIDVKGYTDDTGSPEVNDALSRSRAEAVAIWLASRGVDRGRLRVHGFGERDPASPGTTMQDRQANRRVVVVISNAA